MKTKDPSFSILFILCVVLLSISKVNGQADSIFLHVLDGDDGTNHINNVLIATNINPTFLFTSTKKPIRISAKPAPTLNFISRSKKDVKVKLGTKLSKVESIDIHMSKSPQKDTIISGTIYLNGKVAKGAVITDQNSSNFIKTGKDGKYSIKVKLMENGKQRISVAFASAKLQRLFQQTGPTIDLTITTSDDGENAKIDVYFDDIGPVRVHKLH